MVNRKLITCTAWTRHGVIKFTREINGYLAKGWELLSIEFDQKWYGTFCCSVLGMTSHCDCECDCCTGEAQHDEDCSCACDCCMIHSGHTKKAPKSLEEDEE